MIIDNEVAIIREKLREMGYRIRRSHRFRELVKFDEHWGHIFDLFYENPFLRLIFQHFLSASNISDVSTIFTEFRDNLERIEQVIPKIPLYVDVCPNCDSFDFIRKKVSGKNVYYCKSCRQQFEYPVQKPSLSEFGVFDMYRFLINLVEAGVLTRAYQLTCYRCGKVTIFYEYDNIEILSCRECNEIRELSHIFSVVEPPKEIQNLDSIWLEWYVYKILKEKCQGSILSVVPVHEIVGENLKTEVDLLVLTKNGKLLSLDCKAKHFRKMLSKDDIDPNILSWNNFSDRIGIVTTSKISNQCIQFWENKLKNPVFVDGSKLEKFDEILSNFFE
jgi:transcription elongation factor Elf1